MNNNKKIIAIHADTMETRVNPDTKSIDIIFSKHCKTSNLSSIYTLERDQMVVLRDFLNERLCS